MQQESSAQDTETLQRNTSLGSQASGQGTPSSHQSHTSHQDPNIVERPMNGAAVEPTAGLLWNEASQICLKESRVSNGVHL